MKQKPSLWLLISAAVMLLFPWLAVTLVKGDGGLAVSLLLFFTVDPLYALLTGFSAGRDLKSRWFLPLATAALFLLGAWLVFEPGELAFLLYSGIYLAIGTVAMLLSAAYHNHKNRRSV